MEPTTHIYQPTMTADEAEHPGLLNGDMLGQMLLAQSRFLEALERRNRVAVTSAENAEAGHPDALR
jgi:hypothetical protein